MADFVQLWVYLSETPMFGLSATLLVYVAVQAVYEQFGRSPWANPVLWSILVIGGVLVVTKTPYPTYFAGAQFVHVMLGPAVVVLGWPLWQRRAQLRRRGLPLVIAALCGGAAAAGSAVLIGWACGLDPGMLRSLAPKSVTAPVAMGIAERIGGVPALSAAFAVVTGVIGAVSARTLFDLLGIRSWATRGFALGTAAHGVGTARALEVHPEAGAFAAIALGLQVLLAAVLIPLAAAWLS